MDCFNCKEIISNENLMIHLGDGDFVCDNKCNIEFKKERDTFFSEIGNNEWYEENYFKLLISK